MPPGTWSDDSSLAFCLAEALAEGFDLEIIKKNFVNWYYQNFWTPHGHVFDSGNSTRAAIFRLSKGVTPHFAGGFHEDDNGNDSLMRILPLVFYIKDKPAKERFQITRSVSSLTHGHIRVDNSMLLLSRICKAIVERRGKILHL